MADDDGDELSRRVRETVERNNEEQRKVGRAHEMILRGEAPPAEWRPLIGILELNDSDIADLTPLAGLGELRMLWLNQTPVADLAPLAGLDGLKYIFLEDTHVTDLAPLAGLTRLQTLRLSGTQVSDLSPLAGLTSLRVLALSRTRVTDLAPLARLPKLDLVELEGTEITDLGPVAHVKEIIAPDGRKLRRARKKASTSRKPRKATSFDIKPAGTELAVAPSEAGHQAERVICPFDFTVVPGAEAEAALATMRTELPGTTPVIFGSPSTAARLIERVGWSDDAPEEILEAAATLDLDAWLAEREADLRKEFTRGKEHWPPHGPWPASVAAQKELYLIRDGGSFAPQVVIGLLPCANSAEAAAHLRFGAWNECPEPAVHVALARRWAAAHGAVLAVNIQDALEFRVARPIATRAEAMAMAMTHYLYCNETVDMRPEYSLEFAAALVTGATAWQFWWD
jgi:hypothetical protein